MSWSDLPQELHRQIYDYLSRDDCKSLRLTSRDNATAIGPTLFRTVHLTPNTRSFDRARGIAESPSLSRHVRAIIYHLGVLEDVHNGFQTFRTDMMRIHRPVGNLDDITRDILWKYNCFLEEMDGQRDFETRDEFEELKVVCEAFNFLDSITTILDEDDPFVPPVDYIGKRTGVSSACSADGAHFSCLFNAAQGKRLTSIHAWSMSWRCLPRIAVQALAKTDLKGMNSLALGLFNSEYLELEESDQTMTLEALDAFLSASISRYDYELRLDFDEIPYMSMGHQLQPISEIVFKHYWPSLRRLALEGIAATEDSIIGFLEKHARSLKELHLDDIEIIDEYVYDADGNWISLPGSVLSLFHRIGQTLNLDTALISGTFTNRRDESWYVDLDYGNEICMRKDIELWLSRKGPAPFPDELLHVRHQVSTNETGTTIQDAAPSEGTKMVIPAGYSDSSWVWESDLVDSNQIDDDS